MTEIVLDGSTATIRYQRFGKVVEVKAENPLAWTNEKARFSPGGLWAYALLDGVHPGIRDRFLLVTRRRYLRTQFGRQAGSWEIPLLASPFRLEMVREDQTGRVGVLQAGRNIYVVSSWGYMIAVLEVGEEKTRNGLVRLRADRVHKLRGQSALDLWEKTIAPNVEAFLDGILAYGEEYLNLNLREEE